MIAIFAQVVVLPVALRPVAAPGRWLLVVRLGGVAVLWGLLGLRFADADGAVGG